MASSILVSLIICVYNGESHIGECLASLKDRDDDSLEIIVVDDGSTDGTVALIRNLQNSFLSLKVVPLAANCGIGNARNVGLSVATGEYVYFLDSDDELLGSSFSFDTLKSDVVDLVFTPHTRDSTMVFSSDFFEDLMSDGVASREKLLSLCLKFQSWPSECWGIFIRRELLVLFDIKFPHARIAEDVPFMTRVFCSVESISQIDNPVYWHKSRPGSASKDFGEPLVESWIAVSSQLFEMYRDYRNGSAEAALVFHQFSFSVTNLIFAVERTGDMDVMSPGISNEWTSKSPLLTLGQDGSMDEWPASLPDIRVLSARMESFIDGLLKDYEHRQVFIYPYTAITLGLASMLKRLGYQVAGLVDDNPERLAVQRAPQPVTLSAVSEAQGASSLFIICHDRINVTRAIGERLGAKFPKGYDALVLQSSDISGALGLHPQIVTRN
jgi:glycosyltransferase involved in cell wall biosynthesis